MSYGTGATVRAHGFTAPAAGKTGTEHDSWFAGYSSNLLCVIWVGNDDYTDIKLQGADAAAPIWAEFMNRAIRIPQYSDMKPLGPVPSGVEVLRIDRTTGLIADDSCPNNAFSAAFLVGAAPQGTCSHMGDDSQSRSAAADLRFFSRENACTPKLPLQLPMTHSRPIRRSIEICCKRYLALARTSPRMRPRSNVS